MRSKEEIEKESAQFEAPVNLQSRLILEVLLDIRDLLLKIANQPSPLTQNKG